eukprot:s1533_g2.t1
MVAACIVVASYCCLAQLGSKPGLHEPRNWMKAKALQMAPASTLEAAQVELRKMLAELVARCAKPLDEAEMDAAIVHEMGLQGYHLESAPVLPDDSALVAQELQRRKRRRLTGKTTASSQLELESNKEGTKLPSDHGSDEVREAAPSSPGQSEDVEANSPCMGEEELASPPGLEDFEEPSDSDSGETIFLSRKALLALQTRSLNNESISSDSIYSLFDGSTLQDGEALIALDASQLMEPWPASTAAGVEALLALGMPETVRRILGAAAGNITEEDGEEEECEEDACFEEVQKRAPGGVSASVLEVMDEEYDVIVCGTGSGPSLLFNLGLVAKPRRWPPNPRKLAKPVAMITAHPNNGVPDESSGCQRAATTVIWPSQAGHRKHDWGGHHARLPLGSFGCAGVRDVFAGPAGPCRGCFDGSFAGAGRGASAGFMEDSSQDINFRKACIGKRVSVGQNQYGGFITARKATDRQVRFWKKLTDEGIPLVATRVRDSAYQRIRGHAVVVKQCESVEADLCLIIEDFVDWRSGSLARSIQEVVNTVPDFDVAILGRNDQEFRCADLEPALGSFARVRCSPIANYAYVVHRRHFQAMFEALNSPGEICGYHTDIYFGTEQMYAVNASSRWYVKSPLPVRVRWQRTPSPGDFASRCALGALSSRPVVLLHPMRAGGTSLCDLAAQWIDVGRRGGVDNCRIDSLQAFRDAAGIFEAIGVDVAAFPATAKSAEMEAKVQFFEQVGRASEAALETRRGGKGRRRGVLNFAKQGLSDADITRLDLCEEYDNDYEEVDFSDNSFSGRGLRCILDLCSRCRRLKVLKLFKNDLDDAGAELLARFLEHCPNLEELHLSHNRISSSGALSLISAGSSCRREGDTPLWLRLEHNCLESVEEAESWLYRQYSVCYKQNAECTARHCKYRCKIHAPYMAKQSPRGHSHQSPRPASEPGRHRTWSHAYSQDQAAEEASYKRQRSWQRHDEGRGSGHEDRDRWDRSEHPWTEEPLHLKKDQEGPAQECADASRLQHGPSSGGDSHRSEEAAGGTAVKGEVKEEESEDDVEIVEPGKGSDSTSEQLQGSELQAWEAALRRWEARLDTREKKIRALQSSLPRAAREKLAQLVPPQVVLPRDRPYAFQRALAEAMSSADEPR